MGVCICGLPVNSVCVSVCVHSFFMRARIYLCHTGSAHVGETDSSDRKAQVTEKSSMSKSTQITSGGTSYCSSLQQPLDRG